MTLTASDVASLKSALDCWELGEYFSTAVVFLGCVGEFIAEFTKLRDEKWRHKLAKVSTILVILGIAGELLATVKTSQLSGQVIAYVEANASDAKGSADKAADAANRANASEEALEKKADALTVRLESASRQLGTIERDIDIQGPRWRLLEKDAPTLIKQLSPFAGQRIWTYICGPANASSGIPATDEAVTTAEVLTSILGEKGAKWGTVRNGYRESAADALDRDFPAGFWSDCESKMHEARLLRFGNSFRGLKIFVSSSAPSETRDAATALNRALSETFPFPSPDDQLMVKEQEPGRGEWIEVNGRSVPDTFNPTWRVRRDNGGISILIGAHPQKR